VSIETLGNRGASTQKLILVLRYRVSKPLRVKCLRVCPIERVFLTVILFHSEGTSGIKISSLFTDKHGTQSHEFGKSILVLLAYYRPARDLSSELFEVLNLFIALIMLA